MSRFTLSILFVFAAISLSGQNISVTFTGTGAATRIDSVTATNLASSQRVTLPGNETLILTDNTGISSTPSLAGMVTVFPNPFSGRATVSITVGSEQVVGIKVQNMIGQVVAQLKSSVQPGDNAFAVSVNSPGIYVVSVTTDLGTAGYKVMCTDVSNTENSIQFLSNRPLSSGLKSSETTYTLGYTVGDVILYRCAGYTYTTILTDSPVSSRNYEVDFVSCSDKDSKNYPVVKIGDQTWMASNLAYLPMVSASTAGSGTAPFYYVYGYEGSNVSAAKVSPNFGTYGVLYNCEAAKTACPSGWHLPSDAEWTQLTDYLGSSAGGKMKETGSEHWSGDNTGATNSSGFSALPGGARPGNGGNADLGNKGYFWSSTGSGALNAWLRSLEFGSGAVNRASDLPSNGYSVRCVLGAGLPVVVTDSLKVASETSATGGGNVTDDGGATVTARGVCWNTGGTPTVTNAKTTDGSGTGKFISTLTGLAAGSTYHVRAYAINSSGTAYGEEKQVTTGQSVSLLEVKSVLSATQDKFIEFGQQSGTTPQEALSLAAAWLSIQPNVTDASILDSVYIDIRLKSGLSATFMLDLMGPDGLSINRGGGSGGTLLKFSNATQSKNVIQNKKVLLCYPNVNEFYTDAEVSRFISRLQTNDAGLVITDKYNDEVTPDIVRHFGDYGLVIINSHGHPDSFLSGKLEFSSIDTTEQMVRDWIVDHFSQQSLDDFNKGLLRLGWQVRTTTGLDWIKKWVKSDGGFTMWIGGEFIKSLPPMPNTIILGNFCHSGESFPKQYYENPIGAAFKSLNLISYYCYDLGNGSSSKVDNSFAKQMEDSLTRALIFDKDSTGNAYLNSAGAEFFDPAFKVYLKQFGPKDYSYSDCVDVFTDNRDGIIYKAACIGKQNWMAENLRYNAPGSTYYNDDAVNGPVYGKLYDWNTIMNGAATSSADPSGVKGICPTGWHLPSQAEWQTLIDATGGVNAAGRVLKSDNLWYMGGNGTNASGFTALPAGIFNGIHWNSLTTATYFWSTTESPTDASNVQIISLDYSTDGASIHPVYKLGGGAFPFLASCRCLKDK